MALCGLKMFEAKRIFELMYGKKITMVVEELVERSNWNESFSEVIQQQNACMSNVKQNETICRWKIKDLAVREYLGYKRFSWVKLAIYKTVIKS